MRQRKNNDRLEVRINKTTKKEFGAACRYNSESASECLTRHIHRIIARAAVKRQRSEALRIGQITDTEPQIDDNQP